MSYLVFSGTKNSVGILIDASAEPASVITDMKRKQISLEYILLTHSHLDHTFYLEKWLEIIPNIRIGAHISVVKDLANRGLTNIFPLRDGMTFHLGEETLQVMTSPGHTFDSVCFKDQKGQNLFSGDVIICGTIGCCDYRAGGNRNIFYQSIIKLLEAMSVRTRLYPGHFSEYNKMPPPYTLADEIKNNPYIQKILQGKRHDFSQDLKNFSREFENYYWTLLDETEIDLAYALEEQIWIPELRASKSLFLERMQNGHKIRAIKGKSGFSGMISWHYADFSTQKEHSSFPKKFLDFASSKSCVSSQFCSAFIYSVGVKPDIRNKGVGSLLLQQAWEEIKADGIDEIFLDSRLPSYNGSNIGPHESVSINPLFRDAINRYFREGYFPTREEFMLDPVVRFYMRNGLQPWLIINDFIQDKPSGNIRIICHLNLKQAKVAATTSYSIGHIKLDDQHILCL